MTIRDAMAAKLEYLRLPIWADTAYLRLPLLVDGGYGPWAMVTDPSGAQSVSMFALLHDTESRYEAMEAPAWPVPLS